VRGWNPEAGTIVIFVVLLVVVLVLVVE